MTLQVPGRKKNPPPTTTQAPAMVYFFKSSLGWMFFVCDAESIKRFSFGYPSQTAANTALQSALTKDRASRKDIPSSKDRACDSGNSQDAIRVAKRDDLPAWAQTAEQQLLRFASGTRQDLHEIPLDFSPLTEFSTRVVRACREVQWGQRLSYGQLAARCQSPLASRAVGGVMAANRFPLIVPCHRIQAADGSLRGFSAPDGLKMKQRLLDQES